MNPSPSTVRAADAAAFAIASEFDLGGCVVAAMPYGAGHINDTYVIDIAVVDDDDCYDDSYGDDYDDDSSQSSRRLRHYILQRINSDVFRNPIEVMENVVRVCDHMRYRLLSAGKTDVDRRSLRLVPTRAEEDKEGGYRMAMVHGDDDGRGRRPQWWFVDDVGDYWRCYHLVPNATGRDAITSTDQARSAAFAYGNFQSLLSDLPGGGSSLHETIRNFHHTPTHYDRFRNAVSRDAYGRASSAISEIEFAKSRESDVHVLVNALRDGTVPIRVVHNDAKFGNVLLDDITNEGMCVVDLDTVMPGTVLYDFGDLVRTCTCTAHEDELDPSKVSMRFDMFEALVCGYVESTRDFLTSLERSLLPLSGKLISFEIGLRFLTDYLEGDVYFKVDRERHNLDRARVQFRLVESIEKQMSEMQAFVNGYV
jgi:hypothetical protein